jgi:hypothetical protein
MRVFLRTLLFVLLLSATAHAEPLYLNLGQFIMQSPDPPVSVGFLVSVPPSAGPIGVTISGLQPFTAPETFTIDAASAASYGLDWGDFVSRFTNTRQTLVQRVLNDQIQPFSFHPITNLVGGVYDDHGGGLNIALDRVEGVLLKYGFSGFQFDFTAYGDGTFVPEPPCAFLFLIACLAPFRRAMCCRARRH